MAKKVDLNKPISDPEKEDISHPHHPHNTSMAPLRIMDNLVTNKNFNPFTVLGKGRDRPPMTNEEHFKFSQKVENLN